MVDTALAESGIIGTGIGRALRGFRRSASPVRRVRVPAFDQIVGQLAKMRLRSLAT